MNFILAPSKWLSRWIKVDKWDYFHFRSQALFSLFYFNFNLFFFKYETIIRRSACCLVIQIQIQAVCPPIQKSYIYHLFLSKGFENNILNPTY